MRNAIRPQSEAQGQVQIHGTRKSGSLCLQEIVKIYFVPCRPSASGSPSQTSRNEHELSQNGQNGSTHAEPDLSNEASSSSSSCSLDSLEGGGHSRGQGGVGQDDAWEIVQDGSQLSDFRGSQLQSAELQSGGGPSTLRHSESPFPNS